MNRQTTPRRGARFLISVCRLPLLVVAIWATGCGATRPTAVSQNALPSKPNNPQIGIASYYADKYHGRTTANGEVFDMYKLTAAHRTYPFGTTVRVTHLGNDHSVLVRINDRGPYIAGRIIDLSLAAARELNMVQAGLAQVKVEIVDQKQASR